MIYEKANVTGKITVELEAEDWVWLCNLLSQILRSNDLDRFSKQDTQHLLQVLKSAEDGQ